MSDDAPPQYPDWQRMEALGQANQARLVQIANTSVNDKKVNLSNELFLTHKVEYLLDTLFGPLEPKNLKRVRFEIGWQEHIAGVCGNAESQIRQAQLTVDQQPPGTKSGLIIPGK